MVSRLDGATELCLSYIIPYTRVVASARFELGVQINRCVPDRAAQQIAHMQTAEAALSRLGAHPAWGEWSLHAAHRPPSCLQVGTLAEDPSIHPIESQPRRRMTLWGWVVVFRRQCAATC